MTLRHQTILWILGSGLVLSLISGVVLYAEGRQRILREQTLRLQAEMDRAAQQLKTSLEAHITALNVWRELPLTVSQTLRGDPDLLLLDFLRRVAPAYPLFHTLRVVNRDRRVLASTSLKEVDRPFPFPPFSSGGNETLRVWLPIQTPTPHPETLGWMVGDILATDLRTWLFGETYPTSRIIFGEPEKGGGIRRVIRLDSHFALPSVVLEMRPESTRYVREVRRWVIRLVLSEILFLMLLILTVGWGMDRILLEPMDRIRAFVGALREGNYRQRLPVGGPEEIAQLQRDLNRMARALEERERARALLGKYVHPDLVPHLLEHPEALQRERREITVLFVDIQGFTAFADTHPLDEVVEALQTALTGFSRAVTREGGMVDKFLGDGLLALFNAPIPAPDHPRRAVRAALHILTDPALRALPFRFGMGIHTGEALVGRLGSVEKEEYTAIGHTVNLASRLEHATRSLGFSLLVSDPVYRVAEDLLVGARRVEIQIRGVRSPVIAWGYPSSSRST